MKFWVPILALAIALSPLSLLHPIRVHGHSMEPTLRNGQVRWVLRRWAAGPPRRDEIWLVETSDGPLLKRVLGLPGEILEMREGDLFRSGVRQNEPYLRYSEKNSAGPWKAGEGYLVLGDNRPESRDSRTWGPLPRSAFKGRVLDPVS